MNSDGYTLPPVGVRTRSGVWRITVVDECHESDDKNNEDNWSNCMTSECKTQQSFFPQDSRYNDDSELCLGKSGHRTDIHKLRTEWSPHRKLQSEDDEGYVFVGMNGGKIKVANSPNSEGNSRLWDGVEDLLVERPMLLLRRGGVVLMQKLLKIQEKNWLHAMRSCCIGGRGREVEALISDVCARSLARFIRERERILNAKVYECKNVHVNDCRRNSRNVTDDDLCRCSQQHCSYQSMSSHKDEKCKHNNQREGSWQHKGNNYGDVCSPGVAILGAKGSGRRFTLAALAYHSPWRVIRACPHSDSGSKSIRTYMKLGDVCNGEDGFSAVLDLEAFLYGRAPVTKEEEPRWILTKSERSKRGPVFRHDKNPAENEGFSFISTRPCFGVVSLEGALEMCLQEANSRQIISRSLLSKLSHLDQVYMTKESEKNGPLLRPTGSSELALLAFCGGVSLMLIENVCMLRDFDKEITLKSSGPFKFPSRGSVVRKLLLNFMLNCTYHDLPVCIWMLMDIPGGHLQSGHKISSEWRLRDMFPSEFMGWGRVNAAVEFRSSLTNSQRMQIIEKMIKKRPFEHICDCENMQGNQCNSETEIRHGNGIAKDTRDIQDEQPKRLATVIASWTAGFTVADLWQLVNESKRQSLKRQIYLRKLKNNDEVGMKKYYIYRNNCTGDNLLDGLNVIDFQAGYANMTPSSLRCIKVGEVARVVPKIEDNYIDDVDNMIDELYVHSRCNPSRGSGVGVIRELENEFKANDKERDFCRSIGANIFQKGFIDKAAGIVGGFGAILGEDELLHMLRINIINPFFDCEKLVGTDGRAQNYILAAKHFQELEINSADDRQSNKPENMLADIHISCDGKHLQDGCVRPPAGILLTGEPGTGKTFMAFAIATELHLPIFHLPATCLLRKEVGSSEQQVHYFFRHVYEHSPAVLLLEDIDAIAPNIENKVNELINTPMSSPLVNAILQQLDTLHLHTEVNDPGLVLVICTARRAGDIDQRFLKPGRLEQVYRTRDASSWSVDDQVGLLIHLLEGRKGLSVDFVVLKNVVNFYFNMRSESKSIRSHNSKTPSFWASVCHEASVEAVRRFTELNFRAFSNTEENANEEFGCSEELKIEVEDFINVVKRLVQP